MGALVVLADSAQGTQVVGIVTDRDLVIEALARGLDATQTEVGRFADGKLAAVKRRSEPRRGDRDDEEKGRAPPARRR